MPCKCFDCGVTKNLKSGWVDTLEDPMKRCSFCCKCFYDNECCNGEVSHVTRENWNDYVYQWFLKRNLTESRNN